MEDEPVEQEPSEQTALSDIDYILFLHSSPLPFVHSDYEKKVDEDSETHPDDYTRYLQPIGGHTQCQNHVSNCWFLHVKQLGKTVGIRDLPRVKKPDVHGYDEDPTDVVSDGGHLEDGVCHQASNVDNTAKHTDHQDTRIQCILSFLSVHGGKE